MTQASFRNAPVAALIYEFLYDAYRMIGVDRSHLSWLSDEKATPLGVFDHGFTSKWEWSASILKEVGAIIPIEPPDLPALRGDARRTVSTPFYTPAMTLEACHATDFSSFEAFDNYCYAMFTLDQHVADDDHLSFTSPRFLDAVAARDDIFEVDAFCRVTYSRDRFNEKVMTRWDEMQVREFKAT
ncbi:hypothetical protein MYG64_07280 [Ensifer adhaerens]|uniref:hypothetical protein n=1 Tax=Ensifer adhaerens TaxID=106592 RepID=UPI0021008FF1|nr:hypothetical protein [Ensifer adhaerens]UTV38087.1 hypothetical protein MYG64_07280 [Ensifer adhaerens]